tara:strand:+ start:198 stop:755 length:558 start_codon:yes stop_codon:yes gene_type:complete
MTLPSTGPISFSQLRDEFGGSGPISIGGLRNAAPGLPASGPISMGDFRGKSAETISVTDRTISGFNNAGISVGVIFRTDGIIQRWSSTNGPNDILENWVTPTSAAPSDYQIRASTTGGSPPDGGSSLNTWVPLSSQRTWSRSSSSGTVTSTILIEIRKGTGPVLESGSITISANGGTGGGGIDPT